MSNGSLSERNLVAEAVKHNLKSAVRLGALVKLMAAIGLLLAPFELAAQGLPVRTGSPIPIWIWFAGSGILGVMLAYGIIRNRGRSRSDLSVTEHATKELYAKEERDRARSGEP
jgi:hypothetical protein